MFFSVFDRLWLHVLFRTSQVFKLLQHLQDTIPETNFSINVNQYNAIYPSLSKGFYKMDGRYSDKNLQILSTNYLLFTVTNCLCVLGRCEESFTKSQVLLITILCYLRDISKDRLYSWSFFAPTSENISRRIFLN